VTTAKEPTALLLAFTAHHLALGLDEMHLYLDAPNREFEALAARHSRIKLRHCDAANRQNLHARERPKDHRERQVINANHAYRGTHCDWIAHIGVDEFLIRPAMLRHTLTQAAPEVQVVSVRNAEQVSLRGDAPYSVLGGLFRKPFDAGDARITKICGEAAPYLVRGLSAYAHGKSFYRVGAGLTLGLHQPLPRKIWWQPDNPARKWAPRVGLLHFDAVNKAHWLRKMAARLDSAGKQKTGHNAGRTQQVAIANGLVPTEVKAERLYRMTRHISVRQIVQLFCAQKCLPYRFNIKPAWETIWPDIKCDVSSDAIDQDLKHMGPGV